MVASKVRLFGDDTALSAILASDDPREQKRLGRHVRHFDHELWQSDYENIVLHDNLAKFSQNKEMHLALIQTGDRHLAEASPHHNLWGIGLSACDPRASSPDSWCGQNLLGQALKHVLEILRRDITAPPFHPAPETPVPRDDTGDKVFEVDPVTHIRLDTDPPSANTQTATLSAFTDSVPDDHAPEVLLAQEQRTDVPLIPEEGPDLISGVVAMDDATFTTLLSLHSGVSTTFRFNCRALLDTGSPQSFIYQGTFDQMVATGAADASCVRSTTPRTRSGFRSRQLLSTHRQDRMTVQFNHNDTPSASQFGCTLYSRRLCDAPFCSAAVVGCVSIHAPIKHSRRNKTVASSVNSLSHSGMVISTAPLPISATVRLHTPLITPSTTTLVSPSPSPHSFFW